MKLLVTLEPDETGMLVAECPSIPSCISQGRTEAEALENIREAIAGYLQNCVSDVCAKRIGRELVFSNDSVPLDAYPVRVSSIASGVCFTIFG
jgi:antitoxin HicB